MASLCGPDRRYVLTLTSRVGGFADLWFFPRQLRRPSPMSPPVDTSAGQGIGPVCRFPV